MDRRERGACHVARRGGGGKGWDELGSGAGRKGAGGAAAACRLVRVHLRQCVFAGCVSLFLCPGAAAPSGRCLPCCVPKKFMRARSVTTSTRTFVHSTP